MSLLTQAIRSALAARRDLANPAAPAEPGADAPSNAPAGASGPAWRLLGTETGVQDLEYGDIARPGVQKLFKRQPRRLLDIGCASGAVGAGLKQSHAGLWVWGCELNAQAAQVAATRLDHVTSVPRAQWSAADLDLVKTVDTVLLLDVLEHMYNPWAELEFLAQQLPAEAQVVVSLPNVGHISILEGLSQGEFSYRPTGILDVTHVRFFTFGEMQAMFEQTGFRVDATWVLSSSPNVEIRKFPAKVAAGKLVLDVDSAQDWERLNAIQFGFRLSKKRR
jgi:2-polyprenyl-3-methyl-5-hydroxy-6-metoxy-1,4-benzoquinol methylase